MSDRQAIYSSMAALLSGKQQVVVLALKRGNWDTLFKTGSGWDFSSGSPRLTVIKMAENSREDVMIMDSQLDDRLKDNRYSPFRSALCLPVVKPWGVAALIFVEEPERSQAFSHRHLAPWQELAEKLAETITPEPPQVGRPRWSPRAAGVICVAVFFSLLLGWMLSSPAPPPKPVRKVSTGKAGEPTPEEVATGFLGSINIGRYDMAYTLLKPDLRKSLPQKSFEAQMRRWAARPGMVAEIGQRRAHLENVAAGTATVSLYRGPTPQDAWTWQFSKGPEGWRLDRVPGR